ncbi:hypothetical protein CVT25_003309 [Psilocybe cyanescens]|uniref:Uncharacterized protein n=1 Tax=Psilocybe cyanescens TaxID=93625 RepID=A0A409WMN4_PSICY|nr:hypothetical protein CVT25_003309 [Psilocybe cyanescens]
MTQINDMNRPDPSPSRFSGTTSSHNAHSQHQPHVSRSWVGGDGPPDPTNMEYNDDDDDETKIGDVSDTQSSSSETLNDDASEYSFTVDLDHALESGSFDDDDFHNADADTNQHMHDIVRYPQSTMRSFTTVTNSRPSASFFEGATNVTINGVNFRNGSDITAEQLQHHLGHRQGTTSRPTTVNSNGIFFGAARDVFIYNSGASTNGSQSHHGSQMPRGRGADLHPGGASWTRPPYSASNSPPFYFNSHTRTRYQNQQQFGTNNQPNNRNEQSLRWTADADGTRQFGAGLSNFTINGGNFFSVGGYTHSEGDIEFH